jgi:hypothetical protein
MNIVIVSVLLSLAVVILVPIGFVFGGLWGALLAVFILLLILAGLYVAEEKSVKAAILREQIAAGEAARAGEQPLTEAELKELERGR